MKFSIKKNSKILKKISIFLFTLFFLLFETASPILANNATDSYSDSWKIDVPNSSNFATDGSLKISPVMGGDGADGSVTISADKNINIDTIASGRTTADGITYQVSAIGTNTATTNTSGIEAWWTMNEASGDTIADLSGNSNTGTNNSSTIVSGKYGNARSFNGSQNWYATDSTSLRLQQFTIAAWIKPSTTLQGMASDYPNIGTKQNWTNKTGYMFGVHGANSNNLAGRILGGTNKDTPGYVESSSGSWFHVAFTWDGTYLRVFKNGVQQVATNIGAYTLTHGGENLTIGSGFEGAIDDLRIYSDDRTSGEITNDMNNYSPVLTGIAAGDEVMLINLQGDTTNNGNVGNYEILEVQSISDNTITFTSSITETYGVGGNSDLTGQKIMVQRIPNYKDVTIDTGANLTSNAWNGTLGGILAFKASGTVTVNGTIHANAKGYRGGQSNQQNGEDFEGFKGYGGDSPTCGGGNGASSAAGPVCDRGGGGGGDNGDGSGGGAGGGYGGGGGGGGGGSGNGGYGGGAGGDGGSTGIRGGGGGGGSRNVGVGAGGNGGNAGSNGQTGPSDAGGTGGSVASTDASTAQGGGRNNYAGVGGGGAGGGGMYGTANLSKLFFGSGGGRGQRAAGAGGGIVYIHANTINVNGNVRSQGASGTAGGVPEGAGGGGAGGSVFLKSTTLSIGISKVSAPTSAKSANGYSGSNHGGGGGGGGGVGRVAIEYITSLAGDSSPGANITNISAGSYFTSSTVQSKNLLLGISDTIDSIDEFVYNLSSKPSDTSATVQFSQDASTWKNSAGTGGGTDTLTTGTNNTIDLLGLSWSGTNFYYKIAFTGNGTNTPTLADITVKYRLASTGTTCSPPLGGNFAIASNCSFADDINGVDDGNLTIKSGYTLTINAAQTIAWNSGKSIIIEDDSSIIINSTGQIKQTSLWVKDADDDGYYDEGTDPKAQDNQPTDFIRRYLAISSSSGGSGDGSVTFTVNTNLNTWNHDGRTCADGGDAVNYSVIGLGARFANLSSTPSSGCLAAGDKIFLINLQGNTTTTTNTGNYEVLVIQSISGNTLYFTSDKTKYYGDVANSDNNLGTTTAHQRVMLQRIPQYQNVTVNSAVNVYPNAWDGAKGGVLALKASGTLTVTGTIHADAKGYRGGQSNQQNGEDFEGFKGYGGDSPTCGGGNGASSAAGPVCDRGGGGGGDNGDGSGGGAGGGYGGGGGGGGGGSGNGGYGGGAGGDGGSTGIRGGGGGGGSRNVGVGAGGNGGNAGSNGQTGPSDAGGTGGSVASTDASTAQGGGRNNYAGVGGGGAGGGGMYGTANLSKLFFGSGGGRGQRAAGAGGGIVYIHANTINVNGNVRSQGASGTAGGVPEGAGGGGAGGSVFLKSTTLSIGISKVSAPTSAKSANGYSGSNHGGGGGGGGGVGRIAVGGTSVSGTTNPTYTSVSAP